MPSVTAATWSWWGHSLGGFTAPLVCARIPVDLVVLLAAMILAPGELFSDWCTSGFEGAVIIGTAKFWLPVPFAISVVVARTRRRRAAAVEGGEPERSDKWSGGCSDMLIVLLQGCWVTPALLWTP
jgi:hypothetical protein